MNRSQSQQSVPLPQSSQDSFSDRNQERQFKTANPQTQLMVNNFEFEEQKGYLNTSFLKDENPGFYIQKTELANQTSQKASINQTNTLEYFKRNSEASQQMGLSPLHTVQHKQRLLNRTQQRQEDFHLQIYQQQQQQQEQKSRVLNYYQKIMIHFYTKRFVKKLTMLKNKAKDLSFFQMQLINCHLNEDDDEFSENYQSENPFYNLNNGQNKKLYWKKLQKRIFYILYTCFSKFGFFSIFIYLKQLFDLVPIIQPESTFKNCWDLLVTGIRLYFIILIPVQIAFNIDILYMHASQFTLFAILGLFFDILLNFNTSYYDVGQKVIQRRQIFLNYFNNYFAADFLSTIVLTFFLQNSKAQISSGRNWSMFVLLLFFVQFKNLGKMFRKFEESFNNSKILICSLNLIKVLMIVLFNEHIFSCFWYLVGDLENEQDKQNWIDRFEVDRDNFQEQYITSFYFTCVTMVSVGYGDITPITDLERIVCSIFMLFSCVQLSYSVNAVGAIVQELSSGDEEIIRKLRTMNQYMQKKKISYSLQFQIRQYLSYYFKQQCSSQTSLEQEIIKDLSEPLREKLLMESYSIVIQDFFLFRNNFSSEFKKKVIGIVKEMTIFPEGVISNSMQQDFFLYFIENGKIQVSMEGAKRQKVQILHPGKSFGVLPFLTEKNNQQKYKSLEFSKLLYISKKEFLSLLKEFPEDYEEYCMIKDKIEIYSELQTVDYQCQACNGYHEIQNCRQIHFIPDNEKIIKRQQFHQIQSRQKYKRCELDSTNKYNSLLDQEFFNDLAIALQNQNSDLINNFPYGIGSQGQEEIDQNDNCLISNAQESDEVSQTSSQSQNQKLSKSKLSKSVSSNSNSEQSSKSKTETIQKKKKSDISSQSSVSSKEPELFVPQLPQKIVHPINSRIPVLKRAFTQSKQIQNVPIQQSKRGSVMVPINRFNFQNQQKIEQVGKISKLEKIENGEKGEKGELNILNHIKAGFVQQILESRQQNQLQLSTSGNTNIQQNNLQFQRRSSQKLENFKAFQPINKLSLPNQMIKLNQTPIVQIEEEPIRKKSITMTNNNNNPLTNPIQPLQYFEYQLIEEFNKLQNLWLLKHNDLAKVLQQKDLEQLEFYILKLKLQIEQEFLDFEIFHQYKTYFSSSNSETVIAQVNELNKIKTTILSQNKLLQQEKVFTQFSHYMMYPNLYYKLYKTKQIQRSPRKSLAGRRKSRLIKTRDHQIYPQKE